MRRLVVFLSLFAVNALAGPVDVPVLFSNRTSTALGQSIFVGGSIPQLGNWDSTRAVKLVAGNCDGATCDWTGTIALPEGTSYEYKFVMRNDCATCLGNANNAIWEPGNNRLSSTPVGPPAPFTGKTVFYFSNWSSVSLLYSNTATGNFILQAMLPVSNGLWRADGINKAGEPNLVFVFTDNNGTYDNPDGVPGRNYETPLAAFAVRNGHLFNYWPPSTLSTPRIETFLADSTNVLARMIRVYLPRGYDQNTTKRYPVLYMQDGQSIYQGMLGGCGYSWNVDTNASDLIRFGKMRETIIVGVDNTSERYCEYTPTANPSCAHDQCASPKGDKYAAFLVDELKPQIDGVYRTLPDADNTGAMGSSMGGLISLWLGWWYNDTFHKIGGLSSAFWRCDTLKNELAQAPHRPIRVYLDSGTSGDFSNCTPCYDGVTRTLDARDNLVRNGYVLNNDLDHTIGYNHDHCEFWWDRRVPRALTFLFPTSDEPNTVLDTHAYPPQVIGYASNTVTWTSYRLRAYTVQGSTNEQFSSSMNWSNLVTTVPELRPWNYPVATPSEEFRFLRIRQNTVPDWPN